MIRKVYNMNINLNTSGLVNIVSVLLVITMLILLSGCGQREHIRDMQALQQYHKVFLHNCVVNDKFVCDSIVTGQN